MYLKRILFTYFCECMKALFLKYKAALGFLLRFGLVYLILSAIYKWFLGMYGNHPDAITKNVAILSQKALNALGFVAKSIAHTSDPYYIVYINNMYLARIIEGCNGVNVIILFITFIVAYRGKLKHTLLFLLAGIVFLYVFNIVRIAFIVLGLYYFPEYAEFLHQILFPVLIYGAMFLLWGIWIKKFSVK